MTMDYSIAEAVAALRAAELVIYPTETFYALAADFGRPITATSANLSGQAPIEDPSTVRRLFAADIQVILEDGILHGGAPSTVIEVTDRGYRIVREGAIREAAILAAIKSGEKR